MEVIKKYDGDLGTITITFYEAQNGYENDMYCVEHTHSAIFPYWTYSLTDAMRYAQFLSAKY